LRYFINNLKGSCKNPGKLWETAHNRTQWEIIIMHRGPDQAWYRNRERWGWEESQKAGTVKKEEWGAKQNCQKSLKYLKTRLVISRHCFQQQHFLVCGEYEKTKFCLHRWFLRL